MEDHRDLDAMSGRKAQGLPTAQPFVEVAMSGRKVERAVVAAEYLLNSEPPVSLAAAA